MTTKITCFKCGVPWWIENDHNKELLDHGTAFYCPNGHPQSYTNSRTKLIKRLEENLKAWRQRAIDNRTRVEFYERRARTYKGHFNRLKKQIEKDQENDRTLHC